MPHADRDAVLARVPDRVAHHVLDGAVQQLGIAEHDGVARLGNLDLPAAALRLERGIPPPPRARCREIDRLSGGRGGSALQPASIRSCAISAFRRSASRSMRSRTA